MASSVTRSNRDFWGRRALPAFRWDIESWGNEINAIDPVPPGISSCCHNDRTRTVYVTHFPRSLWKDALLVGRLRAALLQTRATLRNFVSMIEKLPHIPIADPISDLLALCLNHYQEVASCRLVFPIDTRLLIWLAKASLRKPFAWQDKLTMRLKRFCFSLTTFLIK